MEPGPSRPVCASDLYRSLGSARLPRVCTGALGRGDMHDASECAECCCGGRQFGRHGQPWRGRWSVGAPAAYGELLAIWVPLVRVRVRCGARYERRRIRRVHWRRTLLRPARSAPARHFSPRPGVRRQQLARRGVATFTGGAAAVSAPWGPACWRPFPATGGLGRRRGRRGQRRGQRWQCALQPPVGAIELAV